MINKELENFLNDLVLILQEKYSQTLLEGLNETQEEKYLKLGSKLAYYDALDLIKSQLIAFGYNTDTLKSFTSSTSKKI